MVKFLQKRDEEYNSIIKFPYLVLAVSIFITIGITYSFYQSSKNIDAVRFANESNKIQTTIENKINSYIALLSGGRGFIESTENLTRKKFANYVKSLEIDKNYTGIQSIGYSKVVPTKDRENFIESMKADDLPNFESYPEPKSETFQSVIYSEPVNESTEKLIGYDISVEAGRRRALERAADTGKAAATGKITLTEKDETGEEQEGFIIFLPIYKQNGTLDTIEERRKNLDGFIFIPVRAENFLSEIERNLTRDNIGIKIYDGEQSKENLLAQSENLQNQIIGGRADENYSAQKTLSFAGRKWIVNYSTLPLFVQQSSLGWTPLIFLSGIVFSFLLFGMTFWEATARADLQKTAAELFETEKQKQNLLEKEQKARHSAELANTAKDQFISVVSHELKTPLNAISGWTRILKNSSITENTKDLAVEKIEKSLRSQTKLIKDLLDYTQIISGRYNFKGKDVDFSELFEKVFLEIEPSANEKQIGFHKENRLNGERVSGNEEHLKIVIYNLLTNAVKFTDKGGKIEATVRQNKDVIEMSVKDNGKGIKPEYLPLIFESFSQSDSSTTRDYGGMGLGLTVSNHIVKLHHGTIEAKSEGRGKGSEFIVRLPSNTA